MLKILSVLLAFISLSSFAEPVACPLGPKEDHLTLQRVMINFGSYIKDAEMVALKGAKYPNEVITQKEIDAASAKLPVTVACASAVNGNPVGDLLPSKASELQGHERAEYISDFLDFMGEFEDDLKQFQAMFDVMKNQAPEVRDYQSLYDFDMQMNELIDHAHRKTSSAKVLRLLTATAGNTLKQNMKAADKLVKAINASVTDASQNQTNADRAASAAGFFKATLTQTPDEITHMPADQQAAATLDYQKMIQQVVDTCLNVQQAFLQNDNQTAATLMKSLSQQKSDGHHKYNP